MCVRHGIIDRFHATRVRCSEDWCRERVRIRVIRAMAGRQCMLMKVVEKDMPVAGMTSASLPPEISL